MIPQRATLEARRLSGRCANGFEAGKGTAYHAVPAGADRALCGAEPGRRSAYGWLPEKGAAVTCTRCVKRAEARARKEIQGQT